RRHHVLYSPRTSMRYRDDHPLELPSADGCLEDRSSTHDGQHGGTKAQRGYTTDNPAVGGAYRIVITSGGAQRSTARWPRRWKRHLASSKHCYGGADGKCPSR